MDGVREYRCLVGHAYSPPTVLEAHSEAQEKALWAAVVALEEAANLARIVAPQFGTAVAARLERQEEKKKLVQAAEVRAILDRLEPFQVG